MTSFTESLFIVQCGGWQNDTGSGELRCDGQPTKDVVCIGEPTQTTEHLRNLRCNVVFHLPTRTKWVIALFFSGMRLCFLDLSDLQSLKVVDRGGHDRNVPQNLQIDQQQWRTLAVQHRFKKFVATQHAFLCSLCIWALIQEAMDSEYA